MSFLEIRSLAKSFGDHVVLDGVDLSVEHGELVALLGPSGSGKTTLLRLLAGFELPDAGEILVEGGDVARLSPAARGFGMVFQHYALFPHMTVGENVAFGLHGRGRKVVEMMDRVAEALALVDLEGFERRRVSEISGGQQQRVALARALAPKPRLLLLDEPLSNLDPELREQTRQRLKETLRRIGLATVLVTHEQEEAFDLGRRVAVLNRGRLEQVDRPRDLYRQPRTRFVAGFVGRASLLRGELGSDGSVRVGRDASGLEVCWVGAAASALAAGTAVEMAIRPEALQLSPVGTPAALPGRVVESRFSGVFFYVAVETEDHQRLEVACDSEVASGEKVAVTLRPGGLQPRLFAASAEEM